MYRLYLRKEKSCILQSAGQGEKKKNGSHQGILVNLGANWRRRTDDCWEAANARYHPTILPSYKPIDDAKDTRVSHISKQ